MPKYHIGKNGPGVCNARIKCRYGGESGKENHYTTQKAVMEAWVEQEGFTTIPKNPLKKANGNGEIKKVKKSIENYDRFQKFKKITIKNLNNELKRKNLDNDSKKELKNLIKSFKDLDNNNQTVTFLKRLNSDSNTDENFIKAKNTFKEILRASSKEGRAIPDNFSEKHKNVLDEFNRIKANKNFTNKSEDYKKAFNSAYESFSYTSSDEDVEAMVHEFENLMIDSKYNNSRDAVQAYAKAREILLKKMEFKLRIYYQEI